MIFFLHFAEDFLLFKEQLWARQNKDFYIWSSLIFQVSAILKTSRTVKMVAKEVNYNHCFYVFDSMLINIFVRSWSIIQIPVGEHDICDRGDNIRRCHWRGFYPCQFHFQRRSLHLDKSSLQIGFLIISTVHSSCVVMGVFSLCSQGPLSVMAMIRI